MKLAKKMILIVMCLISLVNTKIEISYYSSQNLKLLGLSRDKRQITFDSDKLLIQGDNIKKEPKKFEVKNIKIRFIDWNEALSMEILAHDDINKYNKEGKIKEVILKTIEIIPFKYNWDILRVPLEMPNWRNKFNILSFNCKLKGTKKTLTFRELSSDPGQDTNEDTSITLHYTVSIDYDDFYFRFFDDPSVLANMLGAQVGIRHSLIGHRKFYWLQLNVKKYLLGIDVENETDTIVKGKPMKNFDIVFILQAQNNEQEVKIVFKDEVQDPSFLEFIDKLNEEIEKNKLKRQKIIKQKNNDTSMAIPDPVRKHRRKN
jgi:hypothetical protein